MNSNEIYDLFVAPGTTYQEIADMDGATIEQHVSELREPGVLPGMTDANITEQIRRVAIAELYM